MSDPEPPTGRPRWAKRLTLVALAVAIVALVFTIHDIGLRTLGTYLYRIGWWWLAVVPMEMLATTLHAMTIRAFMSPDKVRLRDALLAQLSGRAINSVTPSGNLGELVKASILTEHVSESRAVSTILLYNVASFSIEMLLIAIATPLVAFLVPMPDSMRWLLLGAGVTCAAISFGLYLLVHRGMLASMARVLVRARLVSQARYDRWHPKLAGIDDKMRLVAGARRRDRWFGIATLTLSRLVSMALSLMILHAVGEPITTKFVAAWVVGSFVIYYAASFVPMGVGVSEGGYYGMFRALGENPARGVTLVLARRTVTIVYAAVGLILMTTSETVKRAKARHRVKAPVADRPVSPSIATPVPVPAEQRD